MLTAFVSLSCENIFAPKIDNSLGSNSILTDQKTVDGVFQNFKYAYTFKDTSVYSQLLTSDFVFTYRDYELGYDVSWDNPTELKTTSGLFQNTQKLEIIWNNIVYQSGDSLKINIKRSFNLTITFNPSDILRLYGFADFNLIRNITDGKWRILKWRDETL
ncbi:hypothetical protein D4R20_03485 [bacterium]|nr:MAG: hypothetical protein D4R20_03485 [bacterium]